MVSIVLIDQTNTIDPSFLHAAADALNYQVSKHLAATWAGISASVSAAPHLAAMPPHSWPVFLVKSLPPGEGGYHLDQHNQPYAKVIASKRDDGWTIDASHEIIEMLVDPFGNRMEPSQAIAIQGNKVVDANGVFQYLVEACDPCEANKFAYDINGIAVSDFITPHYYDASLTPSVRYSFKGNIKRPRQMLKGGYISYVQPDGLWRQILWVDPGPPQYHDLGRVQDIRSLRLEVHGKMGRKLDKAKHSQRRKEVGLDDDVRVRRAAYKEFRCGEDRVRMLEERYGVSSTID
jgi:hypothetical protein